MTPDKLDENAIFCGCQGGDEEANAGRREKAHSQKKHPCADCRFCQWCGDDRCHLCRGVKKRPAGKLSMAEQVALYDALNSGKTSSSDSSD